VQIINVFLLVVREGASSLVNLESLKGMWELNDFKITFF
jgi:hypothetical protein